AVHRGDHTRALPAPEAALRTVGVGEAGHEPREKKGPEGQGADQVRHGDLLFRRRGRPRLETWIGRAAAPSEPGPAGRRSGTANGRIPGASRRFAALPRTR